jgi:hypothetical protein
MYNLTVDTAHTFFIGEGQWLVHNKCKFGGGVPSPTGSSLANSARNLYKANLLWWERRSTTIALTEVNGQLYGTVNGGASASAIPKIQAAIEDMGGKFIPNPNGPESHAEVFLYESVAGVQTIGISHTGGPCQSCSNYFSPLIDRVEIAYP